MAHAADDATKKNLPSASSTCSRELVKSGSGKAKVSVAGFSYVDADIAYAKISTSQIKGYVTSCSGTSDNPVAASKITVTMEWRVTTTGIGSCDAGFPSGITCKVDAKKIILKRKWTCKNVSTCTKKFSGELRVYPSDETYKVLRVTYQAHVTAQQSGKDSVPADTERVTWNA